MDVILFGAGDGGKRLFDEISKRYKVIGVVDNDSRKWDKEYINKISVVSPENIKTMKYDAIIVTSVPGRDEIVKQLKTYGISDERIITEYIDFPIESRRTFLCQLSLMQKGIDPEACVMEAGVFQGDFSKYINQYYCMRKCYLFDTFEGFCKTDIEMEAKNGYSNARIGDYSNTSMELVLNKMPYRDMCVVKKGFFPETAREVKDMFCFANLDLDLYQPTLDGLKWLEDRMVSGGVILIHDYFTRNFIGVKYAVDKFMEITKKDNLNLMPIGDGISIAIVGF